MIPLTVLPPMRCDDGCLACCGPVLCKEHEYQAIKKYAAENGIKPIDQGPLTCVWAQNGKCAVYPVRPFICSFFGHSPRLVCERGYNVNVLPGLEKRLTKQYGKPTRWLSEILDEVGT
jgi:hypothetical protein